MNHQNALKTGHQTQTVGAQRPRQVGGHAPERAVDAGESVQRPRAHLEPREPAAGEVVRGVRAAGARGQVRGAQELGGHRLRRHARPRLQLQHARAPAPIRGPLRLHQVPGRASRPRLPPLLQRRHDHQALGLGEQVGLQTGRVKQGQPELLLSIVPVYL